MSDATARLSELAARLEYEPTLLPDLRADGDALADELGGDLALRWRIAVVRGVMARPPDGDAVRETYGELVDRYRHDPTRLAALRPLGDEIRALEASGALPSVLVARSKRK